MTPTTSLVTGYEFLTDSSNAVKNQLAAGHRRDPGFPDQRHVDGGPAPAEARSEHRKKDIVYLAGHFDAGQAFAADNQTTRQRHGADPGVAST